MRNTVKWRHRSPLFSAYFGFLLEHIDSEGKVEYFVFDNGYEAAILLTPVPGKDIQSQREEFEPYLKTLKLD